MLFLLIFVFHTDSIKLRTAPTKIVKTVNEGEVVQEEQLQLSDAQQFQRLFLSEQSTVYRAASSSVDRRNLEDGVLVFIPGLKADRTHLVLSNIAWLKNQNISFECYIYKYESNALSDEAFAPCQVISHRGRWMDHFMMVPLNRTKQKYILHLMDGVQPTKVNLSRMISTMKENDLVHLAPAVYGKHGYWKQVYPHLGFGRFVNFIEFHMDLFTRENFACLQDIADTKGGKYFRNSAGWGVDRAMPLLCSGPMGVIDVMKVEKLHGGSYDKEVAKWEQDQFARSHHISLPFYNANSFQPLKGTILVDDLQCDGIHTGCWAKISKESK